MNIKPITLKRCIIDDDHRVPFVPAPGDTLTFCESEEGALERFRSLPDCNVGDVYLTDIFALNKVRGTLCKPVFVGMLPFGFFGRRKTEGEASEGRFYLYVTEWLF